MTQQPDLDAYAFNNFFLNLLLLIKYLITWAVFFAYQVGEVVQVFLFALPTSPMAHH